MINFSKEQLSARQVAAEMNVSKDYVYDLCRRKNQNFAYQLKQNGKILINTQALSDYVRRNNLLVSRK